MKLAYVGNFRYAHCTEVHLARTLETLGWEVVRLQEDAHIPASIEREAIDHEVDLVLYTRTWGQPPSLTDVWRRLEARGVVTASYHLDLYFGLQREATLENDPFWTTQHVFTPDGDLTSASRFVSMGINHHWSPPAVVHDECVPGLVQPRFQHPVVFVGSGERYHREWPWRGQLLAWLRRCYPQDAFVRYGNENLVVRDRDLNDLYASVGVAVGDSLCPGYTKPNYWCVDEETEILTHRGWLRYDAVERGDLAYTLDPESRLGEWQPIDAVVVFPEMTREMVSLETERHSSLTTLDHRWFTFRNIRTGTLEHEVCPECGWQPDAARSDHSRRWGVSLHRAKAHSIRNPTSLTKIGEFRRSADLKQVDTIPIAAPCRNLPTIPKYEDALVELVAWAWTEGSVNRRETYTAITQSHRVNGRYVARIRACLLSLYGPERTRLHLPRGERGWREVRTESHARRGLTEFRLSRAIGDDLWALAPGHVVDFEFIMSLTAAQLLLFIETSIDADGCRKSSTSRGSTSQATTIAQRDGERLDPFDLACAQLGFATSRVWQPLDGVWLTHVKTRANTAPTRGGTQRRVAHAGIVWCPTTGNGTWLARRRGTVYFTGNSDRVCETLGRGGPLLHPDVPGLRDFMGLVDGVHCRFYKYEDFDGIRRTVDEMLAFPDATRAMADRGQEHVAAHHTYLDRLARALYVMGLRDNPNRPQVEVTGFGTSTVTIDWKDER